MYTSTLKNESERLFTRVTRGTGASCSSSAVASSSAFAFSLYSFFIGIVSFVLRTLDKFQFQSQVRLSQINMGFCWNDSTCSPVPANTTQLFSQSLSSHTLCSCLEILSTTNNLCNFWRSEFQRVSTYAFCSWDDIFTQKRNCSSPTILCKCNESPSTLSTKTSIKWNLCLSWSNQLDTSFRLEKNVAGFPEHQNETSDTDRYKEYFLTAFSQVNVNTMKKNFLSSGLNCRLLNVWEFMYCPVVIKCPALSFEMKGKQRINVAFVSPTILYSIRSVYIMRESMRTMS